ncbi:spindle and kinetochore-associated protein 3 isoform X3 [Alexandromys fortis]|uniref:spindle and kinetochore-associated protein 3 isoform X3 n=1 Tax=Alexandromys fortis TaxID=100897 RepID=UPI0021530EFB|nr:spindle and kinetochore-associated protein 3 isoform X3 [Microtus fortis]
MNPIQSFHSKLRGLAAALDGETARLTRALDGEDSEDFEDSPMRVLYDLLSEVQTLKDDVTTHLNKARLESQESTRFIKATKVLMKKNSTDIMKLREFFQKYGYQTRDKEDSVCELTVSDPTSELGVCEDIQKPGVEGEQSEPCVPSSSVAEKPLLCSPQLSDFGLERYMVSQVPPNPPQTVESPKEECLSETPPAKDSCITVLKTPSSPLSTASREAMGTGPVTTESSFAIPRSISQQLGKTDAEYTDSPLPPKFCTPGLKIPSTVGNRASVYRNYPLSKLNSSSSDLEVEDCAPLILNSDECYENFEDPPSPTITSCENVRTPTPPEVTAIPEDILQMLKHNSNLATPLEVKAKSPRKGFLKYEGQSVRGAANKENW